MNFTSGIFDSRNLPIDGADSVEVIHKLYQNSRAFNSKPN